MTPTVLIREGQLSWGDSPTQKIQGIAYAMDGDTVFHAYATPPTGGHRGSPTSLRFVILASQGALPDSWRSAESLVRADPLQPPYVVVFVAAGSREAKAYYRKHNVGIECDVTFLPEQSHLYSRSKGLLETNELAKKSVGIVGLGSGGAPIAIELAKSAVGGFVLIDFDRLELSNISRHVCGIDDLGRYKTHAVRDAILQRNPYARINTLEVDVNEQTEECLRAFSDVDLIVCASDNDRSRFALNELALKRKVPAIFGRALTRAIGGDVLRVRPYQGPCYSCLYSQDVRQQGGDDEEMSQVRQAKALLPDYTSEQDLNAVIQVGLASDIAPISNFMVKLALVELSRGGHGGIQSLEEDLLADFYIWANRRENVYKDWAKLEFSFNKPSILRWYGARVERDPNCMVCG
jgi:molybdopterin-synthase adenylyltransferase